MEAPKTILRYSETIEVENRAILDDQDVLGVNLMAAPGAGKTTLIIATAAGLFGEANVGAIKGSCGPAPDADTLAAAGIPVAQIQLEGGCHLSGQMVRRALPYIPLDEIDALLVENLGGLACSAHYRLGTHLNVVLSSVTEGHDKPYDQAAGFAAADVVLLNKIDFAPAFGFEPGRFCEAVGQINPTVPIFPLSCRTGEGLAAWVAWLSGVGMSRIARPGAASRAVGAAAHRWKSPRRYGLRKSPAGSRAPRTR